MPPELSLASVAAENALTPTAIQEVDDSSVGVTEGRVSVSVAGAAIVALIGFTFVFGLGLCAANGLTVRAKPFWLIGSAAAGLGIGSVIYRRRGEDAFAMILSSLAMLIAVGPPYVMLMYGCGAIGLPWWDTTFQAFDEVCRVDVGAMVRWTDARPWVKGTLNEIYNSMAYQTAALLFLTGLRRDAFRQQGYLVMMIATMLVCLIGLALFPAIGPYPFCGYEPSVKQQAFIDHLHQLRGGTMTRVFDVPPEGLITNPSFHTVWAILLTWGFAGYRRLRVPMALLNGLVILATLCLGWHFFCDVMFGIAIGLTAIVLWTRFGHRAYDADGSPKVFSLMVPNIGVRRSGTAVTLLLLSLCCGSTTNADSPSAVGSIPDFAAEVWPILSYHCIDCHSGDHAAAGLRLDDRDGLMAGGSRGPAIDRKSPDDSPLVRLIQPDAHPRMPMDAPPLDAADVDVLTRWVRGGAPYGETSRSAVIRLHHSRRIDGALTTVAALLSAPVDSPMRISRHVPAWPITLIMPPVLLLAMLGQFGFGSAAVSWRAWLLMTTSLYGVLLIKYQRDRLDPLTLRGMQHQVELMFGSPPRPTPPTTAPALSRVYYRGNDERDPSMFNGGHYLTSTFELDLVDDAGRVLDTNAASDVPRFIRWRVRRAPHTPDVLFDPESMARVFATSEPRLDHATIADDRVHLGEIEPGQSWEVTYPIGDAAAGVVYLWHTIPNGDDDPLPKLHYAIEYRLTADTDGSNADGDLWMGGMRFTQPFLSFRLPAEQWLSETPIPELPGPNVDDAELLGLTEHADGT